MKFNASLSLFVAVVLLAFGSVSCEKQEQFTVNGQIYGVEKQTIYLEQIGISSVTRLDSVSADATDHFTFKQPRPSDAPDFYRLRFGNQAIHFAIDSTETFEVVFDNETNYTIMYLDTLAAKANVKIKELANAQQQASARYREVKKQFNDQSIAMEDYISKVQEIANGYKEVAKTIITDDLASPAAYFGLFQQIDNLLIFDPEDRADNRLFGAVANTWNTAYPNSSRTQQLVTFYTKGLVANRTPAEVDIKQANDIEEFDILLNDINEKPIRLSEIDARVILVDFTAYGLDASPAHNMQLATAYEKFKNKGFAIYQVSFDSEMHFWKNAAVNLPWTCVIDPQSVYSDLTAKYNIKGIPVGFLFDKNKDLVKRIDDFSTLEKDIQRYLK